MGSFRMAFTVMEKVGACLFMVKCSYLEGKKNIICFPVACVLFLFLSRKLLCYRVMYVGSVGTVCNLAKVEALKLLDKF